MHTMNTSMWLHPATSRNIETLRADDGMLHISETMLAAITDLRITGSFPLHDTDLALSALLPTLPVQIEQHTQWWVTVAKAEAKP